MKDIYQKVRDGDYQTKLPCGSRTPIPKVLTKRALDLTQEEAVSLPQVRADYEAEIQADRLVHDAYQEDYARLAQLFQEDLEAYFETKDNPKASKLYSKLYSKAYERGHSGGFSEILCAYEDMVDLIK